MSDQQRTNNLPPLPIDASLPDIVKTLGLHAAMIISAPPGAGKTTRVPRALYEAGFANNGDVLVLEPRRLAARLASARVAEELGEPLGKSVGYTIRFEKVGGPETKIRFLTEGVLSRRIVQDPLLTNVSVVILDEFHERHLATDLALAFLKRLQAGPRPDLKLVVMSATLDVESLASYLGQCPVIRAPGLSYEVPIEYEINKDDRPLHDKAASAVLRLTRAGLSGDILIFFPGAFEIRRTSQALTSSTAFQGLIPIPLHGDLPAADQARALQPASGRKVILATNVAETSLTIPGIAAVIDSGLAWTAGHSTWNGLPTISLTKISRASAQQRAGRAGRTCDGRVIRLYTRADFQARCEFEIPEIRRSDLAETVLTLHGANVPAVESLPWLEPPPMGALKAAENMLTMLGALDENRRLTNTGRSMLRFPLHPRLARMIREGERLGVPNEIALVAGFLSERDIRLGTRSRLHNESKGTIGLHSATGRSDLIEMSDLFRQAQEAGFDTDRLLNLGLDPQATQAVERTRRQVARLTAPPPTRSTKPSSANEIEEAVLIATLAGFPDRVAKRRARGSSEFVCSGGGSAQLAQSSVVHEAALIVAVDAEERSSGRGASARVRLASAIEADWLAGLFPDAIELNSELVWNQSAGRVDQMRRTVYGQICLESSVQPAPPSSEASQLLKIAAMELGFSVFKDGDALQALRARLRLLADSFPEEGFTEMEDEDLSAAVTEACAQKSTLGDLAKVSLSDTLLRTLSKRQIDLLRRETPEHITLPSRRSVKIHYEQGTSPWIESRLQDFFGMIASPALCAGQIPVTVHLLAPNGRAVQVTQDLAGFWDRHYPTLRRELQRRYPRHAWPAPGDACMPGSSQRHPRERK